MIVNILRITDFEAVDIDKLIKYISSKKKNRIAKFLRREDKVRGVLGELLIRKMIIEEFRLTNQQITFGNKEYGKPYLLKNENIH